MTFVSSAEMKVSLSPEQAEMLSTGETIRQIIRENPDSVMAFDILDGDELIGFVLVHRFEDRKYFLWEFAIDICFQNHHKGTHALRSTSIFCGNTRSISASRISTRERER